MTDRISRRRFMERATIAGSTALLGTSANATHDSSVPLDTLTEQETRTGKVQKQPQTNKSKKAQKSAPNYEDIIRLPILNAQLEPHWFAGDARFWYRKQLPLGNREFIVVEANTGKRGAAFDHARLADGLNLVAGTTYSPNRLPFDSITFSDEGKYVRFSTEGKNYQCDLSTYVCTILQTEIHTDKTTAVTTEALVDAEKPGLVSPDEHWIAMIRDHNLFVRNISTKKEKTLTHDGTGEYFYDNLRWSPDSRTLVAFRTRPVTIKPVYTVESSPKDKQTRGVLHKQEYAQPGDPFPTFEPWLFYPQTGDGKAVITDPIAFGEEPPDLFWRPNGSGFLYEQVERGHQRFRILAVDTQTGQTTTILEERSKTFIHTSHSYTHYTKNATEVLYISEQDGWRHLYLYDAVKGGLENQITHGEWVVRAIDQIDEDKRQIWFQASGRNPGENPYHLHFYRIYFDGSGLVELTEGNGSHSVQYSPERAYLIDTYSRPDQPPIHTLRRVSDGTLLCPLETADISALTNAGWQSPEVFNAKGRDGKTDIWGLVFRPLNFDPKKRYPVIENIYAGPHDSFVRQRFASGDGMQSLAELGFIVVQCDGMGTRNRSKAFHDVCWRNLKDAGFPDRIAWIKALAAKYPSVDSTRVGIYGTSAGGQSSTGALLFHPEFYKVAVSSCGCHDNRVDKRWWNEQWMGYPVGPWYDESSNVVHAANLRGKLLLMVGELDTNVPPESTLRVADALMKADKDFDLLVLTGMDHTGGGIYGERRRRDFFVRHLLGVEPPDRNSPRPVVQPILLKPRAVEEQALAQSNGGADTTIEFHNQMSTDIQIFWLPGDGRQVPYKTLPPGTSHLQHTYSGHYWLVLDKTNKPLAVFVGETAPGIAEVHP